MACLVNVASTEEPEYADRFRSFDSTGNVADNQRLKNGLPSMTNAVSSPFFAQLRLRQP